ncbi:type IV pilus biogenesis/stability protein PilW [Lysobacter silvisoli]|uniref:Type IV pilus biogenesis/stability protein PilW n=1 Tax=Lysobacter silvisoli TaxID=2293254 RepID=A0A371K3K7_9GAMM|nr:type IV pilus biogenesis/stability protein PilW [Lysobacter silvisoli]RDZ28468.1 type IV pilus biogenesis/stability protein PilW [Lysobacter silvisoli]
MRHERQGGARACASWTLRAALLLAALAAVAGCSRLTFVRPDFDKVKYEDTGPHIEVRDDKRSKDANSARNRVQLASAALRSGDLDGAERDARTALKADPRSADAHTLLGAIAARRGNAAVAGEHYKKAVELAPERGAFLNNYGVWLCGNGRAAESLSWFDRALNDSTYPTPGAALANAGSCADSAGQRERAERDLRAAVALDPANALALGSLARIELGKGNAFEARAFSERRLAAAPADAESLVLASQIEQKLGDTAAAARYVQRLRAEFPDAQGSGTGDDGKR